MTSTMYSFVDAFRDNHTANKLTKYIEQLADPDRTYRIIHVCGTHEDPITKYSIRTMLPPNVH